MPLRNERLILEAHLVSSLLASLMREVHLLSQGTAVEPQTPHVCNCAPYCVLSYRLLCTCPFCTSPGSGTLSGYRVTFGWLSPSPPLAVTVSQTCLVFHSLGSLDILLRCLGECLPACL